MTDFFKVAARHDDTLDVSGKNELIVNLGSDSTAPVQRVNLELGLSTCQTAVILARGQAGLADLVPVARRLADAASSATVAQTKCNGQELTCKKACSACCRFLVPLSLPEAMLLEQELKLLPFPHYIRARAELIDAAQRVLAGPAVPAEATGPELSNWYQSLDIACPLNIQGLCTIYARRPLACREHLVARAPAAQEASASGCPGATVLKPAFSTLEALSAITAQLLDQPLDSLIMPMALPFAAQNQALLGHRWDAVELAKLFVEILNEQRQVQNKAA